jgi:AraC-like DNA-binding protein
MIAASRDDDFSSVRFSTRDVPPVGRLNVYREVMDRTVDKAHIDAVGEGISFDGNAYRLPELGIVRAEASPTRVIRTRAQVEGDDQLFLMMLLKGAATLSQLGQEASIPSGSAILYSGADPLRIERTRSRFFIVAMPRAVLEPMIANPDALMSAIPGELEPARLLTGYLRLFLKDMPIETPSLRRLAVDHFHDLVAMAVGATRDATETANGRGVRVARMRAIKADIAQNLEWEVTADRLAARHRVSPRYIRKLFEYENTSLSQYVLRQRLVRVHRMLGDPRSLHLSIGTIAFEAGFGDLSTFNREFRRHFGVTPSDVRAAACRGAT